MSNFKKRVLLKIKILNAFQCRERFGASAHLLLFGCLLGYRHAALFENIGGEYNIPKVAAARTVRDFDDGLTRGKHDVHSCFLSFL